MDKMLERFGMDKSKPVSTPMSQHFKLSALLCPRIDEERATMTRLPNAQTVRCLVYGMVYTRPNISQAVNVVSKYIYNPSKEHWNEVKWVLRYLKGAIRYEILYFYNNYNVVSFVDSDYA